MAQISQTTQITVRACSTCHLIYHNHVLNTRCISCVGGAIEKFTYSGLELAQQRHVARGYYLTPTSRINNTFTFSDWIARGSNTDYWICNTNDSQNSIYDTLKKIETNFASHVKLLSELPSQLSTDTLKAVESNLKETKVFENLPNSKESIFIKHNMEKLTWQLEKLHVLSKLYSYMDTKDKITQVVITMDSLFNDANIKEPVVIGNDDSDSSMDEEPVVID